MNNEQAVRYISKNYNVNHNKCENVAYVFASEDIVEMGVDEWVSTPLSQLLNDFKSHTEEISDEYIEHLSESLMGIDSKMCMLHLKNSLVGVVDSMIHYADMHGKIKELSQR